MSPIQVPIWYFKWCVGLLRVVSVRRRVTVWPQHSFAFTSANSKKSVQHHAKNGKYFFNSCIKLNILILFVSKTIFFYFKVHEKFKLKYLRLIFWDYTVFDFDMILISACFWGYIWYFQSEFLTIHEFSAIMKFHDKHFLEYSMQKGIKDVSRKIVK